MHKLSTTAAALAAVSALALSSTPAQAGYEPFIGEIQIFGFNFCPRGWSPLDGQLLPIAQYTALFSLYGTQFGGNGQTTFALPDLRSRVPVGQGLGPGLSNYNMGQVAGSETNTMTVLNMPAHNHVAHVNIARVNANTRSPVGATFSRAAEIAYSETGVPTSAYRMAANTVTTDVSGASAPINNIQPVQVVNVCVALEGIFPSRN